MATRRMIAYWVVLAAAALTTLVTAAVAAALAVFAGQALPLAIRHDLVTAPGTALSVTGLVSDPSQAGPDSAAVRSRVAAALPGIPFSFQEAFWSDPLGLVPGALPASPTSAGRGNTPLLQASAMGEVDSHAILIAGRWPTAPGSGRTRVIPAALPASAAALLDVRAGDVLRLRDRTTSAFVSFDITGIFTPREGPGAGSYWTLSDIPASGMANSGGFTTYGPLVVSQASFGPMLAMSGGSWVAQPDMAAFAGGALSPVSASVTALSQSLPNSTTPPGAQVSTNLPSVLAGAGTNLAVARSVLLISALQLLVLASVALLAVARLLAAQREGESALLIARGAKRSQLTRLTAAEVIPLAVIMSAVGAFAGIRLASVLASAGPLGAAGIRLGGPAGAYLDALGAAAAVAVVTIVALLAPGLTPSPSPGAARVRRGRRAMVAGVTRAGLDIALVLLAVLAGWQLRQYSAVSNGGIAGIDPVLVLAPALALAAGSVAALRLLPVAARVADRLAARGTGLPAALAGWQFSRMPVRQGSAALLLIMAVATGTLALAQHDSWTRSAADQAAFATGGDVQVTLPAPLAAGRVGAVTGATGVTRSVAVATDVEAGPGEVVAIDSAQAPQVTRLPSGSVFHAISPAGGLPGDLLTAPQPGTRPGTIRLTAALGPAAPMPAGRISGLAAQLGSVTVTLTILDQSGSAYQVTAGTLIADSRPHLLVASLGGSRARYPLRVAAITVAYLVPFHATPSMALTVSGLALAGWTGDTSSAAMAGLGPFGQPRTKSTRVTGQAMTVTFSPGYGDDFINSPEPVQYAGQVALLPSAAPVVAIPAIATHAFLAANGIVTGGVVPITINGTLVPLRIVAEVPAFPTVSPQDGALITDLGGLQEYLARRSASPLPVTQWWLATVGRGVPAALPAIVPAGTDIVSAAGLATATMNDPLSAAPQLVLLAMAAATALLALTGFCVSIAADVRQRRAETALLAALGLTAREAAVQLFLEKLLLGLPSAAVGVLLGALVARLLVPAVTLTPAAAQPVPPPVTLYDLSVAVPLALAVAVLPAVAAALAAARRPDPAAELRAAETA
jgi:hypothetical protein